MDKLTKRDEHGIWKLLHHIHDERTVQCILETLGKENWTRPILIESRKYLTPEQKSLFWSMGGCYTEEELDERLDNDEINHEIAKRLEEKGLTGFSDNILENECYLDKIREGEIICEGINVEEIKNMLFE